MMTSNIPDVDALKAQAKRLRQALSWDNCSINHSRALEITAQQWGFRDWNTLSAAVTKQQDPRRIALGDRLSGEYMGHAFEGTVVGASALPEGFVRLNVRFENAVDVVSHDSFSALRKQVTVVVGPDGRSRRKISDGTPYMVLNR
ncbi:MAG: glyoxalase superfamily protein [Pseudoruegeria sp.]